MFMFTMPANPRYFLCAFFAGLPPQWELECHKQLEADVAAGKYYLAQQRTMEFEMHACEMVMNSADPIHFDTLHAPLPVRQKSA